MDYKVLARKWRPRNFRAVVGQQATLTALQNALAKQQVHHAYLFTGTRGVGKTTIARILAKCLNCAEGIVAEPCGTCDLCTSIDRGECVDVIEVDAASRTKVEDTRDLLDNVPYAPVHGRFKIYIIDEVHMLSKHSFNALLKTLEEPPEHVKFILATTDPQKLPDTVLSRCLQFHLRSLTIEQIQSHLQDILQQEQIPCEPAALAVVAKCANGSMRDALSLLEQVIAFGDRNVTLQAAEQILGTAIQAQTLELLRQIIASDAKQALAVVRELAAHNADFNLVLKELQTLIYQAALAHIVPEDTSAAINELAAQIEAIDLQVLYQTALLGVRDLPYAPDIVIGFEMIVLRMIAFQPVLENTGPVIDKLQPKQMPAPVNSTPVAPVSGKPSWTQTIAQLNLTGISKVIAEHCTVHAWRPDQIILTLSEAQKPLLNDKHIERIQEALRTHLRTNVQVQINVGAVHSDPPAIAKQNAAEQAIKTDKHIQQFEQTFAATIADINTRET